MNIETEKEQYDTYFLVAALGGQGDAGSRVEAGAAAAFLPLLQLHPIARPKDLGIRRQQQHQEAEITGQATGDRALVAQLLQRPLQLQPHDVR